MVSAMTEGVKNKNRGMQVVKLHVPFLFLLHTVRYQSHRMPRIEPWEQTKTTAHLKKRMEWRNWVFRGCVCSSSRCSGARWLGLSNRLARTEYHSRLVLSTLILQFFRKKGVPAGVLAFFLYSAQRKPLALAENPLVFYCFLQWFLLL